MTHSDHPQRPPRRRGPKQRNDASEPSRTGAGTRRGGDRRPYPTAPTTTRVSPAKLGTTSGRTRTHGTATTPTPATVWTSGSTAIDPVTTWPAPIITKIVNSFSKPRDRITILPWPGPSTSATLPSQGRRGTIEYAFDAPKKDDPTYAAAIIESLDRRATALDVSTVSSATRRSCETFGTDPAGYADGSLALDYVAAEPASVDLIITSLHPGHNEHVCDVVALLAARLLRVGGILAVLTHCDWTHGELMDPTGAIVASAQNADLLYLQHVVALHTPIREGELAAALSGPNAVAEARSRHRAEVRGLPVPHRRIHSDVLVFAQPHDHEPPQQAPADSAFETGVIR